MKYKTKRSKIINPGFRCLVCKKRLKLDTYATIVFEKGFNSMLTDNLCIDEKCVTMWILQQL